MTVADEVIQRVDARVGEVIRGKWKLEGVLGIGGMAAVYSAVHRNQNRVAIKLLHPELSVVANVRTRFLREGYVANTVAHPGVVRVLDDDVTEDGAAFLVMELLSGETLESRLARHQGRLSPGEALLWTDQLLDVLAAAHERGVLHRDVKPENLFLTLEGRLKVLDFGIARVRDGAAGSTSIGTFMGTPSYMAPEQARGRWDEVDPRSDVWSAGATLFTMLSGRVVHEADTVNEQLALAMGTPAPSLAQVTEGLPASLVHAVDKALAYERSSRWASASNMQAALREVMTEVAPPSAISVIPAPVASRVQVVDRSADTLAAGSPPSGRATDSGSTAAATAHALTATARPLRKVGASRRWALIGVAAAAAVVAAAILLAPADHETPTVEPGTAGPHPRARSAESGSAEATDVSASGQPSIDLKPEPETVPPSPDVPDERRSTANAAAEPLEEARKLDLMATRRDEAGAGQPARKPAGKATAKPKDAVNFDAAPRLESTAKRATGTSGAKPKATTQPGTKADPFDLRY